MDQPLADRFDLALLDLDGVVYVGSQAVPVPSRPSPRPGPGDSGPPLSRTTPRAPPSISAHLVSLGIDCTEQDVVTSAMAGAALLAGMVPPGAPVLVVGGPGLSWAVREHGLRPVSSCRTGRRQ
jgi:ribonucleotide monophosphatase NagD (HAD superfamily)